jgi:manganese/zinc/iron transport system permease protein
MMSVAAGLLLMIATLLSPRHGLIPRFFRQHLLSLRILADDVVAILYRIGEKSPQASSSISELRDLLLCGHVSLRSVLAWLSFRGEVQRDGQRITLTDMGRERAQNLVRSHRLWEQYLQDLAGVDASRVHLQAEKMEHFTDDKLRRRLNLETETPQVDPHGSPIPDETSAPPPA